MDTNVVPLVFREMSVLQVAEQVQRLSRAKGLLSNLLVLRHQTSNSPPSQVQRFEKMRMLTMVLMEGLPEQVK